MAKSTTDDTVKDAKTLAKEAREWASSHEGQRSIQEALRETAAMASALSEARAIDPESLRGPITQFKS